MTRSPLDEIDLAALRESYPHEQHHELRHQTARAHGLWKRLQDDDTPGAILGDEVGKGKTYVALALAFAMLASQPKGRVLVLTHNRPMAKIWASRWSQAIRQMVPAKWRARFDTDWQPRVVTQYDEFVDTLEKTSGAPAILFASYDTLKRFHSHQDRRRRLMGLLRLAFRAHRVRLSRAATLYLTKTIVPGGGRMPRRSIPVTESDGVRVLKRCFDRETRDWRPKLRRDLEDFLYSEAARDLRISPKLDLLIVDEAHKLEGHRRGSVVTHLLSGKFRKGLWVTATPFALTLQELRRRLHQFEHGTSARAGYQAMVDALPLADYQRAVSDRDDFPQLDELQTALRRQMVRSTWDNRNGRSILDWTGKAQGSALLPSMALERAISNILSDGDQTHIASLRETLCSSWAATLESLNNGALARYRHDPWTERLHRALTGAVGHDPKLREAVDQLAKLAQAGEKTVVFTHRTETSVALVRALQQDARIRALTSSLRKSGKRWRERAPRIQAALGIRSARHALTVAKVIASSPDAPRDASTGAVRTWWRKHRKALDAQHQSTEQPDLFSFLETVAGRARRLPIVARYDGLVSGGDEAEPDSVGNDQKFNLPCSPLILIASRKGQEGIDLHHYCRRVVLYDLPWNPALIEQRIGRVHRLGGMRSRKRPVEVVYCYQHGGYEELIAQRVKRRCEMMHALLGAGTWLNQGMEVENLERYRMTFPP